jgi:hypothetical protein
MSTTACPSDDFGNLQHRPPPDQLALPDFMRRPGQAVDVPAAAVDTR